MGKLCQTVQLEFILHMLLLCNSNSDEKSELNMPLIWSQEGFQSSKLPSLYKIHCIR